MLRYPLLLTAACAALMFAACSSSTGPDEGPLGDPGPGANATWDRRFGDDTTHPNRVILGGSVRELVIYNGKLHGAGLVDVAVPGPGRYNGVFTWDTTTVAPLPSLIGNGTTNFSEVLDAAVVGNKLYALTDFDNNGGTLAIWNGITWTYNAAGAGLRNLEGGGALYTFTSTIDTSTVSRFNGTGFELVGGRGFSGSTERIASIAADGNTVYVTTKKAGGVGITGKTWVYRLEGNAWVAMGGEIDGTADLIEKIGNSLYLLGRFRGTDMTVPLLKWNGNGWDKIAAEIEDDAYAFVGLARDSRGDLYVAKEATVYKVSGNTATLVATAFIGSIRSVVVMGNQLILGGSFFKVNNTTSQYLAVLR